LGPTVELNSPAPNVNWAVPGTYLNPWPDGIVTAIVDPPTGQAMSAAAV
jgi:hypothetical protein